MLPRIRLAKSTCDAIFRQMHCSTPRCSIRSDFSKADRDPNWESLTKCKGGPACPERADDICGPMKNHQQPYQQQWCDNNAEPLPKPAYVPRECCVVEPPRRARKVVKVPSSGNACSSMPASVKCDDGGVDRCIKILSRGCGAVRVPTTCVRITLPLLCKRIVAPTPSFHECLKDPTPPLPPDECHCHDKKPSCVPNKVMLADR